MLRSRNFFDEAKAEFEAAKEIARNNEVREYVARFAEHDRKFDQTLAFIGFSHF